MPFITAERIHDGHGWLPAGTVLEIDADGTIIDICHDGLQYNDVAYFDGVLAPGFVNAHCHLELSHMKGAIPRGTGLVPFLQTVTFHRNDFKDEQKKAARQAAYKELLKNGVVAVGDIANSTDTLDLRALDELHMHTFVECIGFSEEHAAQRFAFSAGIYNTFADQERNAKRLHQSIVPHAPYSVSPALFALIDDYAPDSIMSIHNQESNAENEYYYSKQGDINKLLASFGIDAGFFKPSGLSSVQTYLGYLSQHHPLILVHNTYTSEDDVAFVNSRFDACWCLCPNANLYIEGTFPDIDMFLRNGLDLCIGTDSLASNERLSILSELHALKEHYPGLDWEHLIKWGTSGGAYALQLEEVCGSLKPGMRPGILQTP